MILSDIAEFSMTRSVARSLCDSWAFCFDTCMNGVYWCDRCRSTHLPCVAIGSANKIRLISSSLTATLSTSVIRSKVYTYTLIVDSLIVLFYSLIPLFAPILDRVSSAECLKRTFEIALACYRNLLWNFVK